MRFRHGQQIAIVLTHPQELLFALQYIACCEVL